MRLRGERTVKPLYINGRPGMTVALDGPALAIGAPGRAESLFPLQRISRVIASGSVDWSTTALLACAERGITVTFLDRHGVNRAYLFGDGPRREGLAQRLRDLLDRPDWPERYADWRRAMESRACRAAALRLGLQTPPPPAQLRETLERFKLRYVRPGVRRFINQRLQGLLAGLVAELLTEAGITAEQARGLGGRLPLIDDLVDLLAWDLHLPLARWLEQQAVEERIEDAHLISLFEQRSERLRSIGRSILNRLHGWLMDL